jgi:coproporphyrinogen III oxidase-like Fe-S oxidoreductase
MRPLPALFVDIRRKTPFMDSLPHHAFSMAYLVGGTLEQSSDFFRTHHAALATIPHITFEITQKETLHLATRIPSLTRLSLPAEWVLPDLHHYFEIDAIIQWDHRKSLNHYKNLLQSLCEHPIPHISLYGLHDFAIWLEIQDFIQTFGFSFYERFHAARENQQSRYQNHIAASHDVIAWGGWSRHTDDLDVMRVRGPRAKRWTILTDEQKRTERIILGLSSHQGIPLSWLTAQAIESALQHNLASCTDGKLIPTHAGLWDTTTLINCIL